MTTLYTEDNGNTSNCPHSPLFLHLSLSVSLTKKYQKTEEREIKTVQTNGKQFQDTHKTKW